MFVPGGRFSLNIQTKSSLSEPLKLTPKRQQWQLGAALLNIIDKFIDDQDVNADETQDNDEKKNMNEKNDVNENEKDDKKIQKT